MEKIRKFDMGFCSNQAVGPEIGNVDCVKTKLVIPTTKILKPMAGIYASCYPPAWRVACRPPPPPLVISPGMKNEVIFVSYRRPCSVGPITTLFASSRKSNTSAPTSNLNKKKKQKKNKTRPRDDEAMEKDFDGDPIEALFNLLEEDLKNDLPSEELDEELTEEELAKLEQELEEALGDDDELSDMLSSDSETEELDDDDDEDDDEEEKPVELKKWQLRRLASALKIGRRKTSIKSLAAELCLDRAVVLELLREPPPDLLLLSAALPDRITPTTSEPETQNNMEQSAELTEDILKPQPEVKMPVHVMQSRWALQKRLKKVQVETLERVYSRSKRPTNAMISSIVHVTNLPRKRVLKWFEDKRAEDGVPNDRPAFQRSPSETVITN